MSARGKGGKEKGGTGLGGKGKGRKKGSKVISMSKRAGLTFPVGRLRRYLKRGRYAPRIGKGAAIFLAAVIEYVAAEVLEIAGDETKKQQRKTISPRHIMLAIKRDEELNLVCSDVIFPHSGVIENIPSVLLPKKIKRRKK